MKTVNTGKYLTENEIDIENLNRRIVELEEQVKSIPKILKDIVDTNELDESYGVTFFNGIDTVIFKDSKIRKEADFNGIQLKDQNQTTQLLFTRTGTDNSAFVRVNDEPEHGGVFTTNLMRLK